MALNGLQAQKWLEKVNKAKDELLGGAGLTQATRIAILNANYIAKRLGDAYPILYSRNGRVAHECIVDTRPMKDRAGVTVDCQPMELKDILGYLKPKLDSWQNKPVILHTDLDAEYKDMVQAYDELARAREVLGYDIPNISIPTAKEIDSYVEIFGYNPFEESCKG